MGDNKVFEELKRIQNEPEYKFKIKDTMSVSEEIKELQRLSEEMKETQYFVTTST
ncbi:hypothetical protein ACTWQB_10880 [Piscibacillus sp. B03]|uniref:hypothetical protein n=1 Tax=Piscibacillus sp. B03 TaxID=3457430 RepID=UPI003FCED1C1